MPENKFFKRQVPIGMTFLEEHEKRQWKSVIADLVYNQQMDDIALSEPARKKKKKKKKKH